MEIPHDLLTSFPKESDLKFTGVLSDVSEEFDIHFNDLQDNKLLFVKNSLYKDQPDSMAENPEEIINKLFLSYQRYHVPTKNIIITKEKPLSSTVNFWDIIRKYSSRKLHKVNVKEKIYKFVYSSQFSFFIGLVVLFNTFVICFETNEKYKRVIPMLFQISDTICIVIFLLEIVFKMTYDFQSFWFNGWNIFDLLIVVLSFAAYSLYYLSSSRVIRIMRVFKSLRIMKAFNVWRPLELIFNAFLLSLRECFSVIVLIALFMVCASFIGLSLFSQESPYWFGTFSKTVWTLVILITQDGWLDAYRDLVDNGQIYVAMVYIFVIIGIGSIMLINILVGVSANSLKVAKEQALKALNSELLLMEFEKKRIKRLKMQTKKTRSPPLLGDGSWDKQLFLNFPDMSNINMDSLMKLYLVKEMLVENNNEFNDLVDQLKHIKFIISGRNES